MAAAVYRSRAAHLVRRAYTWPDVRPGGMYLAGAAGLTRSDSGMGNDAQWLSRSRACWAWMSGSGPSGLSTTVDAPAARNSATRSGIADAGPITVNSASGL